MRKILFDDYWIPPTTGSVNKHKLFKKLERDGWEIVCTQKERYDGAMSFPEVNYKFSHKDYGSKEFYINDEKSLKYFINWYNNLIMIPHDPKENLIQKARDFISNNREDLDGLKQIIEEAIKYGASKTLRYY